MVMGTEKIYEAVLLDADFCSNIALLKMLSPQQHDVPKFGHLDYLFQGLEVVAAGCDRHCGDLRYAEAGYSLGEFRYWKFIIHIYTNILINLSLFM